MSRQSICTSSARAPAPVVVIGSIPADVQVDAVEADSKRGAALAVKHLHAHGRRKIGLINGPVATTPGARAAPRLPERAPRREARARRAVHRGRRRVHRRRRARGDAAAARPRARPDGLLCANDLLAAGAIGALRVGRARRAGGRRRRRHGQQRPRADHVAAADERRPRLRRARAARGRAADRSDRRARSRRRADQGRGATVRSRFDGSRARR